MSMRERKSQIVMRWRIDRIKREDDVMGNILLLYGGYKRKHSIYMHVIIL